MRNSDIRVGRLVGLAGGAENSVPPIGEYEAWAASLSEHHLRRNGITVADYRRMVVMKRAGEYFTTIGKVLRCTPAAARAAYERLPEHLR